MVSWQNGIAPGQRPIFESQFQLRFVNLLKVDKNLKLVISGKKVNIRTLLSIDNYYKLTNNFKTILGPAAVAELVEYSTLHLNVMVRFGPSVPIIDDKILS